MNLGRLDRIGVHEPLRQPLNYTFLSHELIWFVYYRLVAVVIRSRMVKLALNEPSPSFFDIGGQKNGGVEGWKLQTRLQQYPWDLWRPMKDVECDRPQPARILEVNRAIRWRAKVPCVPQVGGEEQCPRFYQPCVRITPHLIRQGGDRVIGAKSVAADAHGDTPARQLPLEISDQGGLARQVQTLDKYHPASHHATSLQSSGTNVPGDVIRWKNSRRLRPQAGSKKLLRSQRVRSSRSSAGTDFDRNRWKGVAPVGRMVKPRSRSTRWVYSTSSRR